VTVRFLADEELDSDIIDGLRSREPAIDIPDVKPPACAGHQIPPYSTLRLNKTGC
jgi:hypothetical protein